jgi:hypothetical protein
LEMGVSQSICLGWSQTVIQVARITGVNHQHMVIMNFWVEKNQDARKNI